MAVLAFLAIFSTGLATGLASRASADSEGHFFHLNIQGLLGRGSDGVQNDIDRLNAANYVATRALDEGIIAVSLNEVCPVQAGIIRLAVNPALTHR